jgi:HEAT repeat protein
MKDLSARIEQLITELDCDDGIRCRKARQSLVTIGPRAIPALTRAAGSSRQMVRWEAIKALSQIADPAAISILVANLGDGGSGIGWIAAEGLARLGKQAVVPVLQALRQNAGSSQFRDGVHHFLVDMLRDDDPDLAVLQPVVASLESPEAGVTSAVAADNALRELKG